MKNGSVLEQHGEWTIFGDANMPHGDAVVNAGVQAAIVNPDDWKALVEAGKADAFIEWLKQEPTP